LTQVLNISRILSTARIIQIASTGRPIVRNTVVSIRIPAQGIHAAQIEARITIATMVS